jgi:hypothetical protein
MKSLFIALLLVVAITSDSKAQEESGGLFNWFGSSDESSVRSSTFFGEKDDDGKGFSLSMPKMGLPFLGDRDEDSNAGSQVVTASGTSPGSKSSKMFSVNPIAKLGSTTKKFWTSTIDLMNPFQKKKSQNNSMFLGGGYKPQGQATPKKKSFWSWGSKEQLPEVDDVNGFLQQARPRLPY